jgi:hypothetical protein
MDLGAVRTPRFVDAGGRTADRLTLSRTVIAQSANAVFAMLAIEG